MPHTKFEPEISLEWTYHCFNNQVLFIFCSCHRARDTVEKVVENMARIIAIYDTVCTMYTIWFSTSRSKIS